MKEVKFYKDLTKYPKIFNCYWGGFSIHNQTEYEINEINEIVKNRNEFVEFFKIKKKQEIFKHRKKFFPEYKKYESPSRSNGYNFLDHVEQYITEDKYSIIVTSPYTPAIQQKDLEYLNNNGWIEIKKLYNTCATTYIKIVKL